MVPELLTKLSSRSNTLASACLVLAGHELLNDGSYQKLAVLVGATVVLTISRHIRDVMIVKDERPAEAGTDSAAPDYDRIGD